MDILTPKCKTRMPPPLSPFSRSFKASGVRGHPSSILTQSHKHTAKTNHPVTLKFLLLRSFVPGQILFIFSVQLEFDCVPRETWTTMAVVPFDGVAQIIPVIQEKSQKRVVMVVMGFNL